MKYLKVKNHNVNAHTILPMIKEYQRSLSRTKLDNKTIDNNTFDNLSKKSTILSQESIYCNTNFSNYCHKNTIILDKRKNFVQIVKKGTKTKEFPKKDTSLSEVRNKWRECTISIESKPLFSNELISKITQCNFNDFLPKRAKSPKFVDLYKLTENKLKKKSGNIFMHPSLLDFYKIK